MKLIESLNGEDEMRIFLDTEFTGLHAKTTLISIGLVADNGSKFYAELTDYDESQIDDWLRDNVISGLRLGATPITYKSICGLICETVGDTSRVCFDLCMWFSQFDKVEIWSDCLAYDWVLFNNIIGRPSFLIFIISNLISSVTLLMNHLHNISRLLIINI